MNKPYRYRSMFWPAILILVGLLALLVNTNAIPTDRLYQLLDLWPVILVVIGLEIILRRGMQGVAGDVAAALVVLLAIGGAVAYIAVAPNPGTTQSFDASGPLGSLDQASLEIDGGGLTITIAGSADLGSDLYRAHISYRGPRPEATLDTSSGKLVISQPDAQTLSLFRDRQFTVDLKLNPGIPWTFVENSGATSDKLDFSTLHVGSIDISTGASHDDITLGPASGIVPVNVNGGALTVEVHRPSGTAASVTVSGGAVNLNADGHQYHAIGDASYSTSDFGSASDGYRISVNGGACTVTLDAA